ncbi:MAG: type III-A CRISPR-associated RAMP protein Csm4 [Clostridia bacterium]|nr:type III-A CRISPR-associated RAMP protein Csm4 [Clostridia bacterium]
MGCEVYKMHFRTAVHFGSGILADSHMTFKADTLFSALCMEALYFGGVQMLEDWVELAREGRVRISDGFPYYGSRLYLPKPLKPFNQIENQKEIDSKVLKKLQYIPAEKIRAFSRDGADQELISDVSLSFGIHHVDQKAAIRGLEETMPYSVGAFTFHQDRGLYVLVAYKDDQALEMFEMLFDALSFRGIGGKTNAGMGKFSFTRDEVPEYISSHLGADHPGMKMTLSTSMAKTEELDEVLKEAYYLLEKRSGFVASENYSDTQMRKKDSYFFRSGSCFSKGYEGDVFDVSEGGTHPVYRYGYPLFLEVE